MPTISVIVPVYNTEPYLHRCVDSILAQTFTDFELILVDDGSTDASGAICDKYAVKDSRVRVFHQKNSGAASARNTGICAAEGEYLAFCDSDDMVSPMWLKRMVDLAREDTLPVGAYCHACEQLGSIMDRDIDAGKPYPRSAYFAFHTAGIAGYICNALYCRAVVLKNRIQLREHQKNSDFNEDLLFALTYVRHMDKLVYTGYADYLYDTREESLSRANTSEYFNKYAEKYRFWREFIVREGSNTEASESQLASEMLYHFLTALHMRRNSLRDIRRIITSEEMQTCVHTGDTSRENPVMIRLIRRRKALLLYGYYQLLQWKGGRST